VQTYRGPLYTDQQVARLKPANPLSWVNVLIEGTTYLDMFDPDNYCLFPKHELEQQFEGWTILESVYQTFSAPREMVKEFVTVIAEHPLRLAVEKQA